MPECVLVPVYSGCPLLWSDRCPLDLGNVAKLRVVLVGGPLPSSFRISMPSLACLQLTTLNLGWRSVDMTEEGGGIVL